MQFGQGHGVEREFRAEAGVGLGVRLAGDVKSALEVRRLRGRREPDEGEVVQIAGRHIVQKGQDGIGGAARGEDFRRQVGVGRQVLDHGGDLHRAPGDVLLRGIGPPPGPRTQGLDLQRVPDRQITPEVLARHPPRDHDGVRLLQRRPQVARQGRNREHLEDVRIGPGESLVGDDRGPWTAAKRDVWRPAETRHGGGSRILRPQPGGNAGGGLVADHRGLAGFHDELGHLVDLRVAGDPTVVAELAPDELGDQDRRGQGHRQPQDADGRVEPVALQVAQGRDHVVAEHGASGPPLSPRQYGGRCLEREIQQRQGLGLRQTWLRQSACPESDIPAQPAVPPPYSYRSAPAGLALATTNDW